MTLIIRLFISAFFGNFAATGTGLAADAGLPTHAGENLALDPTVKARIPLLIYYVADVDAQFASPYQENLDYLVDALRLPSTAPTADDQYLARLGQYLRFDLENLNRSANSELMHLRENLCSPSASLAAGLAIFRTNGIPVTVDPNGFEVRGAWESCTPGDRTGGSRRQIWNLDNHSHVVQDPYWEPQWTGHPSILRAALEQVAEVLPPDQYRYILWLKGRGSNEAIFHPRYSGRFSSVDQGVIRAALLEHKAEIIGEADPTQFAFTTEIGGKVEAVLATLAPSLLSSSQLGTLKSSTLELIGQRGGGNPLLGSFYSLIVFDSTFAPLELAATAPLGGLVSPGDYRNLNLKNIGWIYHFGASPKGEFPFQDLFPSIGPLARDPDLESRLRTKLNQARSPGVPQ